MALPAVRSNGTLSRWDPFRELDDFYGRWVGARTWAPLADVSETDEAYVVEVEVPGVKREDVSLDLAGSTLAISGELKEKEGRFHHRTRRTGKFQYRVTLPRDADGERVEATLDEGVLTVRVPKSEANRPRKIEISAK
jgi:HSP20 family protein